MEFGGTVRHLVADFSVCPSSGSGVMQSKNWQWRSIYSVIPGLNHLYPCMPCAPRTLLATSALFALHQKMQLRFNTNMLVSGSGSPSCGAGEYLRCGLRAVHTEEP